MSGATAPITRRSAFFADEATFICQKRRKFAKKAEIPREE
jgi:hypothetical protein